MKVLKDASLKKQGYFLTFIILLSFLLQFFIVQWYLKDSLTEISELAAGKKFISGVRLLNSSAALTDSVIRLTQHQICNDDLLYKSLIPNLEERIPVMEKEYNSLDSLSDCYPTYANRISDYQHHLREFINSAGDIAFYLRLGKNQQAEKVYSASYKPSYSWLLDAGKEFTDTSVSVEAGYLNLLFNTLSQLNNSIVFFVMAGVLISILAVYLFIAKIHDNIRRLKAIISSAEKDINIASYHNDTDFFTTIASSINGLTKTVQDVTKFATEISIGNYSAELDSRDQKELSDALNKVKNNLMRFSEAEKQTTWSSEGIDDFNSYIRRNDQDIKTTCERTASFISEYLNAYLVTVYIHERDNPEGECLSLAACTVNRKKKNAERKILPGEGLAGQCFLEGETILLKSVPQNYIKILPGENDAQPENILIVPLKDSSMVCGVLELASIKAIQKHETEFIKNICRVAAQVISASMVPVQLEPDHNEDLKNEIKQQVEKISQLQKESDKYKHEVFKREQILLNEIKALKNQMGGNKRNGLL
jgi:hypothetical protein